MNIIERVAFTWVVAWVLMDSFVPLTPHTQKLLYSAIPTIGIAFLYNAQGVLYSKLKSILSKT